MTGAGLWGYGGGQVFLRQAVEGDRHARDGKGMSPGERREYSRIPQAFEVRYRPYGKLGETWKAGVSINLSAGGIRIQSSDALEEGQCVELEIRLPQMAERRVIKGKIVWTQLKAVGVVEHGIVFDDVSPEQKLSIDELVQFLSGPVNPHPDVP